MTPIGINFRQTSGYVTDGTGETYCLGDVYPTTRATYTFGWSGAQSQANRSTTVGPNLAGINYGANTFRIDLPQAGTYKLRIAIGDLFFAQGPQQVLVKDNSTTLVTLTGFSNGDNFIDASNVSRLVADWPTQNVGVNFVFSSTIANFTMNGGGLPVIACVSLELQAAPGAPTNYYSQQRIR